MARQLNLFSFTPEIKFWQKAPRHLHVPLIYHDQQPIGFCTISKKYHNRYLDVWVMPRYRDLGFGSLLINKANQECLSLYGKLPAGHDKNITYCWDARFRRESYERSQRDVYKVELNTTYHFLEAQTCMFDNNKLKQELNESRKSSLIDAIKKLCADVSVDLTAMRTLLLGFK